MADALVCLLCGEPIRRSALDPCSAVIATAGSEPERGEREERGGGEAGAAGEGSVPVEVPTSWWRRPPGQFWLHAACLRRVAHPSVPLHFLDIAEGT